MTPAKMFYRDVLLTRVVLINECGTLDTNFATRTIVNGIDKAELVMTSFGTSLRRLTLPQTRQKFSDTMIVGTTRVITNRKPTDPEFPNLKKITVHDEGNVTVSARTMYFTVISNDAFRQGSRESNVEVQPPSAKLPGNRLFEWTE